MPTRVTNMPGGAEGNIDEVVPQARLRVTEAMIDEAAENALRGVSDDQAYATRRLWALDPNLEVANAFHVSQANARERSNFARIANIKYTCRYVLTQEEVTTVVENYPEFDIVFRSEQVHDHPLGAVFRALDQRLLESRLPPGVRYKDIGGNLISHVERGDVGAITVRGLHDNKDPVRDAQTHMRLKQIASGRVQVAGGDQSRAMAQDILAGGERYCVARDARTDDTKAFGAIMNQVYDIPMESLPIIMDNGNINVLEGTVHFSNDFFELNQGEMPTIGARYEIDVAKDVFRMGFVGSAAPMYEHRFSDFARYGTDQVLEGHRSLYAYKVIERRGDTLHFRVLRVGNGAVPNKRQYYALPGVEVVDVDGFELFEGSVSTQGPLRRKTWRFPANTWHTLMRDASTRAARGGLDFQDLVNTYRVSVVAHHINGVSVAPGSKVDMDLVMPMVLHAGFAAYADMVLFDSEIANSMKRAQVLRNLSEESTVYKAFRVFVDAAKAAIGVLGVPIQLLGKLMVTRSVDELRELMIQWRPVPRFRRIHAANIVHLGDSDKNYYGNTEMIYQDHMLRRQDQDLIYDISQNPEVAKAILSACGEFLPEKYRLKLAAAEPEVSEGRELPGDTDSTRPPTYVTDDPGEHVSVERGETLVNREANRTNAMLEAIQENEMEARKIEGTCIKNLRELSSNGTVNRAMLLRARERMQDPDMWLVRNGVLVQSCLGVEPCKFSYAAVCTAKPDGETNSHIWAVSEEVFEGPDSSTGLESERKHFTVRDKSYSGWVFVNDTLKIYNGPDCLKALRAAVDLEVEYELHVHQGGPGAGKTTQIVAGYTEGDVVLCPVRESTEDTRSELSKKFPGHSSGYWRQQVRTLDSLLVNYLKDGKDVGFSCGKIHADEAFMAPSGKWHAAFRLLGANRIVAYGDVKQIPHIPRVDAPKMYVRLQPDLWYMHWLVYRCAPEIMAIWAGQYEYKLRTKVKRGGVVMRVFSHEGLDVSGNTALLVMYQAEKLTLKSLYPRFKGRILTTHESEGKTFDKVFLFNFETRQRPKTDAFYLYNKPEHLVVATSRARKSFVYVKKANTPDPLLEWMEAAKDPRRIAAVSDVASAGMSKEFL